MRNKYNRQRDIVHAGFEIGLLLKGLDGLLEIVGGVLLLFLDPARLNWLIRILTQHELSEDPGDLVANALLGISSGFSVSAQQFGVFYLISHGVVKLILILLLWRKKRWAYPLTIASLLAFMGYQVYRYTLAHAAFLLLLTVFDLVMIALTYLEYRNLAPTVQKRD